MKYFLPSLVMFFWKPSPPELSFPRALCTQGLNSGGRRETPREYLLPECTAPLFTGVALRTHLNFIS